MRVLKFGSMSIASPQRMKLAAEIVLKSPRCVVILSAMAGTTAALEETSNYFYHKNIEGANEIINRLETKYLTEISSLYSSEQTKAAAIEFVSSKFNYMRSFSNELFTLFEERIILAQGELLSSGLFHLLLTETMADAVFVQAADFMQTDKNKEPDHVHIKEHLKAILGANTEASVFVTQGYICRNVYGEIDDLRSSGGSDYTASLVGAAIGADEIQIWTDVNNMQNDENSDSEIFSGSQPVRQLDFDEAAELAYFGAKILHPTCVLPAKMANIPVRMLNILEPENKGTIISNKTETGTIKAVAAKDGITIVQIKSGRMLLVHGFLRKIFEIFDYYQTAIDMIATSEVSISVTIDNPRNLQAITDDLKKYGTVSVDQNMSLICVVGDLDWNTLGYSSQILDAVKTVPLRMVSYGGSNNNMSFLVRQQDKATALALLNKQLF
ncbi:aspartate kinase [Dysgonomonas sp. PH5-45]|uniref:aspartate kinase n=1 Tax=unclassified Dysgonomonas TaxID=2630389 RepID=UPI002476BC20|nr:MULTISPECIES: aspartate kinase [unclassified Dysgonomonas]MDH6354201.1 aspartate kinase [Dysgonomonas sp. PH5-45]MDH6387102.1 aspartate kinase [Dysgonomonas sp. PH5-37]